MAADEELRRLRELLAAMQKRQTHLEERLDTAEKNVEGLRGALELLGNVLASGGTLNEGHQRLIARLADRNPAPLPPVKEGVHLAVYVDKYEVQNADIDCGARIHLCYGRCCTLRFELTTQDLDDGIRFEVDRPYEIRHEADAYCTHYDREHGYCGTYENRPATCRIYTCKTDKRIWIDFEKMIPQPLREGIVVPAAFSKREG